MQQKNQSETAVFWQYSKSSEGRRRWELLKKGTWRRGGGRRGEAWKQKGRKERKGRRAKGEGESVLQYCHLLVLHNYPICFLGRCFKLILKQQYILCTSVPQQFKRFGVFSASGSGYCLNNLETKGVFSTRIWSTKSYGAGFLLSQRWCLSPYQCTWKDQRQSFLSHCCFFISLQL